MAKEIFNQNVPIAIGFYLSKTKYKKGVELKKNLFTLAGVAQWIEHEPADRRVAGSISCQGTTGLQARSPVGGVQEATHHINVSPRLFLPLLSPPSKNE